MEIARLTVGIGMGLLACAQLIACSNQDRRPPPPTSGASARATGGEVEQPAGDGAAVPRATTGVAGRAAAPPATQPAAAGRSAVDPGAGPPDVVLLGQEGDVAQHEEDHEHLHGAAHRGAADRPRLGGPLPDGRPGWSCNDDRAFRPASAVVFSEPTPGPIASALTECARGGRVLTLVLRHKGDDFLAALSATQPGASGRESFLPGKAPLFSPLVPAFGDQPAVTGEAPQPSAALHLVDRKGPVVLEVQRLVWRATVGASCGEMQIDAYADIPLSEYGRTLHLAGGDKTIAELAGVTAPPGGFVDHDRPRTNDGMAQQPLRETIHFTFKSTSTPFDYDSL